MSPPTPLDLTRSGQSLRVAPEIGGAIARYRLAHDGAPVDLLRPTDAASRDVLAFACFPLVPYSSRIRHGQFRFRGREIRLPLNFGAHPHSIHGHGWQRPWSVVAEEPHAATLHYEHAADAWPWAYRVRQVIALDGEGLAIELSATNLSGSPMPIGLGFHPYFPRAREARLKANVGSVWRMDDEIMPIERVRLPAGLDLPGGVALSGVTLDNGFEGWDGVARIDWPGAGIGLELRASALLAQRLVVYAPAGEDFFCVEPVSHMTDAFNRADRGEPDTGMRVLEPGETVSASMCLTPRRL